jgi:6,7-dimethyl-8-ribityllumazine synthase
MNEYKGSLDASGKRFAVVAGRFNESFTANLVNGAVDCLGRLGADEEDVDLYWVPGSFELAHAARGAAASGRYDAVIALGVLIRGSTPHFDLVAGETVRGLGAVGRDTGIPTVFGVVTADTLEQAAERCGSKMGNRGWDAAQAAVEMVNLGEAFGGWDSMAAHDHAHDHPEPAPAKTAKPGGRGRRKA